MWFGLRWQMFMAFIASAMGKESSLGVLAALFNTSGIWGAIDGSSAVNTATLGTSLIESVSKPEALAFPDAIKSDITAEDYFRAKFVIGEKERVLAVCDALNAGDYETVGKKMYETHEGLSKDYEVSCEELDFLNDVAKEMGVTGSRIMGGGFGGCTINLVKKDLHDKFIKEAVKRFNEKYGHEPMIYDVVISDGARKIEE